MLVSTKNARELLQVMKWLATYDNVKFAGFEAHPLYCSEAASKLQISTHKVDVVNAALVGPEHGTTIQLNLNGSDGVGDNLIRGSGSQKMSVKACRLSEYLLKEDIEPDKDVILLRMNFEGAELFVLQDLISSGLIGKIDGFYGRWVDPKKIGNATAVEFAKLVNQHKIQHLPFNNKDLGSMLRVFAIKYDLNTSLIA